MDSDGGLSLVSLKTQYRTYEDDLVASFYRPCMRNSTNYSRAVGYFRSSIYLVVGAEVVDFAKRGGKIRLVCSPSMASEDIESIQTGYEARRAVIEQLLIEEIDSLLANETTAYRTRVLATLVASGALDVRIAVRPDASGLYHEKIGIFRDESGAAVSFLGSANETWNGWHERGNHEVIEVFCDWRDSSERERVRLHEEYFERLWMGRVQGLQVLDFPEAARRKLTSVGLSDIQDLDFSDILVPQTRRRPMKHQIDALKAWKENGSKGIFEHATGSGKTFLALTAVKEHLDKGLPALILVPSSLLLKQWAEEVSEELPGATVLMAGGGHTRWTKQSRLRSMSHASPSHGARVIISTMQTAATDPFLKGIDGGDHLMVVADEVHQIGSPHNSRALQVPSGSRIGLSATPKRYGDPEGTAKIFQYFGDAIPPPVTLQDAIDAGRLVGYEYYPHPVRLTADEADEWRRYSRLISREVARRSDPEARGTVLSDRAKMLLIQRSRIAKKARGKVNLASKTIADHLKPGQRWLVYCEDVEQMSDVMGALDNSGVRSVEYHSAMEGNPESTLEWFRSAGGVLVSIKCLDEGVDIPSADHALILASSQNPRQFIQRRGRVLRKSPGKFKATIHDAIVIPLSLDEEPEQTALLRAEILRAIEFAASALNRSADAELRSIMLELGFDPNALTNTGIEDE